MPERHPTLLAWLIAKSDMTQDEQIAGFDRCARQHHEDATLSLRTLRRWMAGHVTTQPRPAQRRVAQLYWGYAMNELLAPPPHAAVTTRSPAIRVGATSLGVVAQPSLVDGFSEGEAAGDPVLVAPPGRFFAGTTVNVRVFPAVDDGRIMTLIPQGYAHDPFLQRPRRGLVIAATGNGDKVRLFGMDTRQVRKRLAVNAGASRLVVPHAYLIDEITLGILWAVANLDEALLHDDALLAVSLEGLAHFETLARSAGSRDIAADLTTVSGMWLGSDFCARHILRHLDTATGPPVFWTREQRGEEASTWLLFTHKFDYLRNLADRFPAGMVRTFCIPEEMVRSSPMTERILLLLAVALLESFGIRVQVTPEPEYAAVDGFVLDPSGKAIMANWIGVEGIWAVDVTGSRPALRDYADANGHAAVSTAAVGSHAPARLRRLADYLAIPWNNTISRCATLAEYGLAGLAAPRSRLLSLDGVDRACRFLGSITTTMPGR